MTETTDREQIDLKFNNNDLTVYQRWNYKWWFALAELVDNSTHSYFEHKAELDEAYKSDSEESGLVVRIVCDKNADGSQNLSVYDNAFGMDLSALEDAFDFGRPKPNPGRSAYGLGMKTSGIWIGPDFIIETSQLGDPYKYTVNFDMKKAMAGSSLDLFTEDADEDAHYTLIKFPKIANTLVKRTTGKVKTYLGSIYRIDIRNGDLSLEFNSDVLVDPMVKLLAKIRKSAAGDEFIKRNINLDLGGGKTVSGWVGILHTGKRKEAGFATIVNDRVIEGYPDAWRPYSIFGDEASNDTVNQRMVGEFTFKGFNLSQTKDQIMYSPQEDEQINNWLERELASYKVEALKRKSEGGSSGPGDAIVHATVAELDAVLVSAESVRLHESPPSLPSEVLHDHHDQLVADLPTDPSEYDMETKVGEMVVKIIFRDQSINDPYFEYEIPNTDELIVIINRAHPAHQELHSSEAHLVYVRHCIVDALAAHHIDKWKDLETVDRFTALKYKDDRLRILKDPDSI